MSQRNKETFNAFAPLCGVIGPAIIALGMLLSALTYSGSAGQPYSPLNHFVSELGEVGVAELSGAFNWGLIVGGLVTIPFMIYLAAQVKFWMRWPLAFIGVLTAVFAVLVGVFPMNYVAPHAFVALTFFWLGMVTCILYSLVILLSRRHPFAKWLALPGLLYVLTFAWFSFFPDLIPIDSGFSPGSDDFWLSRPDIVAITVIEWILVLSVLLWIFLMGAYSSAQREKLPAAPDPNP